MIRSVEIKGPTVALLVMDDLIAWPYTPVMPIIKATRPLMALAATEPTKAQRTAWSRLTAADRTKVRDECLKNTPATLTVMWTEGHAAPSNLQWSVRRG